MKVSGKKLKYCFEYLSYMRLILIAIRSLRVSSMLMGK